MSDGRENAEAKGMRYLTEGRLTVTFVHDRRIRAVCRGSGAVYTLGHDHGGFWCECPARGRCAHLAALGLVVAPRKETWQR